MRAWTAAIAFVLDQEGGLITHPTDPGGTTKYGISRAAFPDLDIEHLTRDEAVAIYRRHYWDDLRLDLLPPALAVVTFDCAVNQGPTRAVRWLQHVLSVTVDGVIGPQTQAAAEAVSSMTVRNFQAYRAVQYAGLETFPTFGLGWMRRLFDGYAAALVLL